MRKKKIISLLELNLLRWINSEVVHHPIPTTNKMYKITEQLNKIVFAPFRSTARTIQNVPQARNEYPLRASECICDLQFSDLSRLYFNI